MSDQGGAGPPGGFAFQAPGQPVRFDFSEGGGSGNDAGGRAAFEFGASGRGTADADDDRRSSADRSDDDSAGSPLGALGAEGTDDDVAELDGVEFDEEMAAELMAMLANAAVDGNTTNERLGEIPDDLIRTVLPALAAAAGDGTLNDREYYKGDGDGTEGITGVQGPPPPLEWDELLSSAQRNMPGRIRQMVREEGVPASHSNGLGQSALHIAVLWGHAECARVLMEHGANVNATNRISGDTPLHTVVQSDKITSPVVRATIIDALLDAGADPTIEDYNKFTPIRYLNNGKHPNKAALEKKLRSRSKPRNAADVMLNGLMSDLPACVMACPPPPVSSRSRPGTAAGGPPPAESTVGGGTPTANASRARSSSPPPLGMSYGPWDDENEGYIT